MAQITFGQSTIGTHDFVGAAAGNVIIGSPGLTGAGTAFFPPDSGDYVLGPMQPTNAGPLSNGTFQLNATQTLSYTATDGDHASGPVTWSLLKDGTAFPDLIGTWAYSSTGDATFLAAFPGGTAQVDFTLVLLPGPTLDHLAAGQGQWSTISSGEGLSQHTAIPEPSGFGMVLLAGLAVFSLWRCRAAS